MTWDGTKYMEAKEKEETPQQSRCSVLTSIDLLAAAVIYTKKTMQTEKLQQRAKAIAKMGLVERIKDGYEVKTPSLRGYQRAYKVSTMFSQAVCNCLDFEANSTENPNNYKCEHILAVEYSKI